jgi:hypothetical protein
MVDEYLIMRVFTFTNQENTTRNMVFFKLKTTPKTYSKKLLSDVLFLLIMIVVSGIIQ